jgi:hypothetical protein
VKIADGIYGEHLRFGSKAITPESAKSYALESGRPWPEAHPRAFPENWAEELTKLEAGLAQLKSLKGKEVLDDATRATILKLMKPVPRSPISIKLLKTGPATPGKNLLIKVKAKDPAKIESMKLRFRHLTQFEDYLTAEMVWNSSTGTYSATIPGEFIESKWDLMYFVEMIDSQGRGAKIPDFRKQIPYVIIPVIRE